MTLSLTWHGHATWMLETPEHKILVDPFFAENPSAKSDPESIEADFILITHGHFDHVADAAAIANRCQSKLIAIYEIANWFNQQHGVQDVVGMNLGGSLELPFGRITMTLAFHSSQLPDGSYGGNPAGYVVEIQGKRIYFAGDTSLFSDMALIGQPGLDVAVLPIGDLFTMGPQASIAATKLLNAQRIVPGHYDTWPPIEQDVDQWAIDLREQTDAEPVVLGVDEGFEV